MRNSVAHENEAARRDSDETMDCDAWHDAAMPTLVMAQGEMFSITELRGQVEQMGRWKEKYDTPNGEVSVDVPIIVLEVERCPVVTVENQKPWNETIIREIQKKTGKREGRHSARMTLMDKRLKFSF